jgi:Tol biopolymer transport system component
MLVWGVAWLPDGSGLVISGSGLENFATPSQLWTLSLPGGTIRRLTNDLNEYQDVSLTADGKSVTSRQKNMSSSIWIALASNPSQAQESPGSGHMDGVRGLAWLPQDRLLYMGSEIDAQIWQMDRDGSHRQQLTHTPGYSQDPTSTADGANLVFSHGDNTHNFGIWRMNLDGTNPRPLLTGKTSVWNPEISSDGKWVVYISNDRGTMKVPAQGGPSVSLDPEGDCGTISCDGGKIAFPHTDQNSHQTTIEVVASNGNGSPSFVPFTSEDHVPQETNMGPLPIR